MEDSRKRTLVRVGERGNISCTVELLDDSLYVSGIGVGRSQLVQFLLQLFSLSHLDQSSGQPSSLLRSNLGGRGVLSGNSVTERKDFRCTCDSQVFVGRDTSSVRLVFRQFSHQLSRQLSGGVTGGPDEQTVRNLVSVLVGILNNDRLFSDILDGGSGHDVDLVGPKGGFGVFDQLLGEGGQHVGKSLDQGDSELVCDFRVPLSEIVLEMVDR
jgi:hypothetical protein